MDRTLQLLREARTQPEGLLDQAEGRGERRGLEQGRRSRIGRRRNRLRGESAEDVCGFDISQLDVDHRESVQNGGDMNTVDVLELGTSKRGNITVDLGAAESVIPHAMLEEIPIRESIGSKTGVSYMAANAGRMPNLGEWHVRFKARDGLNSSVLFQATHARKPLAAVSKTVQKGNKVVFSPSAGPTTWTSTSSRRESR